ncbi:MAG: NAD(P)/FAD-dependent oxidoreductase [Planctomycetes bacterium]|nr:NAD(P)/FAD-dependent oxidoreductase [Planctomycetota bacterium]
MSAARHAASLSACDVAVVGAGPAGTHLALRLARAGRSVVLLDRRTFPRPKPCGEFLSPECVPLLAELGLADALEQDGAHRVEGMRLCGAGLTTVGRFLPVAPAGRAPAHGYALRRELLDLRSFEACVRQPGVTVLAGHAFTGLVRAADGTVCGLRLLDPDHRPLQLPARFTVGADGVHSRVACALDVQRPHRWLDRFAIVARFADPAPRELAEVHFLAGAYAAMAPIDAGELTLNLVFDRAALPRGPRGMEAFLRARLREATGLPRELAERPLTQPLRACGPLAMRTTAQVVAGAALVGDACGYVDPVTGEGLFFAMRGAALLAGHLDAALAQGRTDAASLAGYVRARRREFGPRFALATLLQRGMRHPRVLRTFLALLAARPRCADLLVTLTGDTLPPRALLTPRRLWWALGRSPRVA